MGKAKAKASLDMAVADVWRRELGQLSNRKFANRLAASEDIVLQLDASRTYATDQSCGDGVTFNAAGNLIVSGLAEMRIAMWDWESGISKLAFWSGHEYICKLFVIKIMPYTNDSSLISCSADGQVRHALIMSHCVRNQTMAKHTEGVCDLDVEPGNPNISYSCGADGVVNHIDLRIYAPATKLFTCQPIDDAMPIRQFIPLDHIAVDPLNPNLFAVSGSDKYTRLYDIRKSMRDSSTDFDQFIDHFYLPHLIGEHLVVATGMAFSDHSELLVSYSDSSVCLFTRDMGLGHDPVPSSPFSARNEASEKVIPQLYRGSAKFESGKAVTFLGPKSEYVAMGSDYGRIFIWKKKGGELIRVMEGDEDSVNFIGSHPQTGVLVSSGTDDIKFWTPNAIDKAVLPTQDELNRQVVERPLDYSSDEEHGDNDDDEDE
ncbi:hypothetical protein V6N13_027162 [Hibiscus sabdariffa]